MRLPLLSLLTSFVLGGALPLSTYAQAVPAGEAHFTIVQASDGKTVGSSDYSVAPVAGGYAITSHGEMKLQKFSYSFSNNNRLDAQLNIVHDQLSGTVNGKEVAFNLASDSTGRQFQVNIVASGKTTTNTFDRHQHTVLLPDLDAAAYVEMAHFALVHPETAWIVIPKQEGLLVPAEYTPQPDLPGTFRGQPTTVHHTTIILSEQNGISVELYYKSDGDVLEADLPEQNFYVVRDGFKLQNRPHYTPPQGTAPPANEQQQYPPQQQYPQPPQYPAPQGPPPQIEQQ